MSYFLFRGGPLDGERYQVGNGPNGRPLDVVKVPHPDDLNAIAYDWTDAVPTRATRAIEYYRTRTLAGEVEYWTADERTRQAVRAVEAAASPTLAERVATLEAQVAEAKTSAAALADDFAEMRRQFSAFIDALNSTSTVPSLADEYASRLEP